jgi:N-acetylgalactosamine-N,N'-diacetylbacillosaminyl-diphospho-undecaprenol 4-alpha-N-acetylgalactosaminyltransferase
LNQINKPFKICLTTVSLSGGGAERCAASLSNYFVSQGFEVHHVVFAGEIVYDYSGEILHLEGLKDKTNSIFSRFKRFVALKNYFKNQQFDCIIDFRSKEFFLQEWIIHNFVYKKFIQTIHNNRLDIYIPKNKWKANFLYKNAVHLVSVSDEIERKIKKEYSFNNLSQIYNPVDFKVIDEMKVQKSTFDFSYILAAGRMEDNVKQFDHLIESYAKSELPKNNIKLVIIGDGKLKSDWQILAKSLHVANNVVFLGFVSNPFLYYANALFTVMTSKYEGFPMVLIESLACETPVISYDLKSGPNEIITQQQNGLLVANQNKVAMTLAMSELFLDKELYLRCKQNAKQSVERFSLETIGKQWLQLFEKLKK